MRNPCKMLIAILLVATLRAAGGSMLSYTPCADVTGFHAALRADGKVVVQWRTTVELDVDAFRVWRQPDDGSALQLVGRLAAGGDESGHAYELTDLPAPPGTRRQYVLRIVSRSQPDTEVATWEGPLLPVATPLPAAQSLASAPPVAPLNAPTLRQSWIGSGDRTRRWTNALPADRVRLSLRDEGVYGINAGELAVASGWDIVAITNAMATTNLNLSCQGSPVAWHAETTNLFFYGLPPQSRFAPENVYWVALGAGSNMPPLVISPDTPATTNTWFVSQFQDQGTNYLGRVSRSSLADAPAPYVAFSVISSGQSLLLNEPLIDCATGMWIGAVTVNLLSYYDFGTVNHAARVWVGSTDVGEQSWTDEQYLSCSYPFASSNLVAGVAALQIDNTGGGNFGVVCISCAFSYLRCYRARNNALHCTGGGSNTVAISGFATNDILALDVTSASQPQLMASLGVVFDATSNNWTVSFSCGDTDRVYAVCSKTMGVLQPSVRGVRDVDWSSPANAADYVILVPPEGWRDDIRPVLQPLADFRNAQGLVTKIVDVESLYNQFSHGLVDPQAIHAFCCAGYTNWPTHALKYVLLVGAGCLDFKHDRLSVNDYTACLIPTIISGQCFPSIGEGMTVALDQALGDVTGDAAPEVVIGRLPTTSTQAMATVVQKTMAYEGALPWKLQVSVAADWDNTGDLYYPFANGTDRLTPSLLAAGRTVVKHYPDPSSPSDMYAVLINSLLPAFVHGSGIFHFFGHTNEQQLGGGDLLENGDITSVNWTNAMIAVVIGCRVNRWQSLTTTVCILPYGVFAQGTGFVAALGSTGYQMTGEGEDLGVALYAQAANNGTLRLGDVLKNGLQQMAGIIPAERLQAFCLTGDPALVFRHDITATGTPVAWLAQHGLTAPNADLADTDNDGWPTWQEYLAGTDPTNANSRLAIQQVTASNQNVTINWIGGTSVWQYVECKQNLADTNEAWRPLYTNAPALLTTNLALLDACTNQSLFFRIRTWQQ